MNILFISHENAMNGANRSMLNLIDELYEKHVFFVICRQKDGELINELNQRNIKYICEYFYCWCTYNPRNKLSLAWRKIRWHFKEKIINKKKVSVLMEFIKENNIDIIHMNTGMIDIGVYLKKKSHIPLIWHMREFGKEDFGWEPLVTQNTFYRRIRNNVDIVIAISKAVSMKYEGHLNKDQITVVYNGVGIENKYKKNEEVPNTGKPFIMLQSGVICKQKGQDVSIEAMKLLRAKGYNDIKLLYAGSGRLEDVSTLSDCNCLNIFHLGQISNLNELRKTVDLELVCSKSEAFGRVTVEAMMSSIPVIGSRSGGTVELIKDGWNGFLFEPGNAAELASKIEILYLNRKKLMKMGNNAYNFSKDYFLISRCAEEINEIYHKLERMRYANKS